MGQQMGAVDPTNNGPADRCCGFTTNGPADRCHGSYNDFLLLGCFIPGSFNIGMFGLLRDVLLPLHSGDIG
jgi:hypothetical protein